MSSRVAAPGRGTAIATYAWIVVAAVVLLSPVLLTVVGGFVQSRYLVARPPGLLSGHYSVTSYVDAWSQTVVPLVPAFLNSLFVGLVIMIAHLVTSCLRRTPWSSCAHRCGSRCSGSSWRRS